MENSIRLALYHERYDQDLDDFALSGGQLQFTAMPADVIDEAIQNPDKDPMVILHEEKPVGFFILHKNSEYVEEKDASHTILIRALSISMEHQGNGYAKEAMKALPKFVRQLHPEINEIILAVNEGNIAAQQLYLKVDFLDRGVRKMGIHGLQLILHHRIT
ncbi:GNAT family N-acetyltransferase [Paenibacillus amylolyticus]|uniref:GNAT family N-acetyltransferase n=1 Tax=Paenibacillus amylolyticus TaxID=1451 RepID=UPI00201E031B|nr:GNAT family N-acetyltransferase [Paenibacillus amylolyticus]MCL6660008.1 GNAT family N-acetyltransferase [Paenibacillus amylolyticus]